MAEINANHVLTKKKNRKNDKQMISSEINKYSCRLCFTNKCTFYYYLANYYKENTEQFR